MARWGNWRRLKRLSPHDLRRTAITRALDQGLSYQQVQMMSGHKDPKTVMRYDHGRENLERLYAMKLIRPGVTVLERAVSGARRHAQRETWRKIEPLLSKENRKNLDGLLGVEEKYGVTPLTWFRTGATSHSAGAILNALEKITEMRALGVEEWKLSEFNPNRLKLLARIGKRATNQALERMPEQRRYPILVAFLSQTLIETIDEAVDLFDRCLAEADSRAGRELDEFRKSVAKATNEKVNLFQTIGRIILDPEVKDSEVRRIIYQQIAPDHLRAAVDECERIARPLDDSYFDLLGTRYGNLRQFAPRFLETFTWRANQDDDALLAAIEVIRELNAAGGRKLPDDAPIDFIPPIWAAYVIEENEQLSRRYYELCLLWQMREAMRNGNLWIEGSRRYTNPESYRSDLELRLPPQLSEYSVQGFVVWSDGCPAPGETISLGLLEEGETSGIKSLQADDRGHFTLKVYEGLYYKVSAYPRGASGDAPQSPWVEVPQTPGAKPIKLVLPILKK